MAWAIDQQHVTDPAARHVLLVLANFADSKGRNAFPAASTIARDTGLSERTVRSKLDLLRVAGLIAPGNQAVARVEIARADRRPTVYDLTLSRGASTAPRHGERGANGAVHGVQMAPERGATVAPEPRAKASKSTSPEEQETIARQRTSESAPLFDPRGVELVGGLQRDVLLRFVEHREELGKPVTTAGWEELRDRLQAMWDMGIDLNDSLRTAVAAGYPLPPDPRRGKQAVIERRQERQQRDTAAALTWADRHMPPSRSDREACA